jgi:hypothetical protein
MSPRKRTIDDLDDLDDEDGVLEEESQADTDLTLRLRDPDTLGLGGTPGGTASEKKPLDPDDIGVEEEE